jgi:predicted Fe-Mo cluster-binding NifX family protein
VAAIANLGTPIAISASMKIAIPIWQSRISPVFDVAGQLLLVDWADGREVARTVRLIDETSPDERLKKLAELGVETLICAGISQSLEIALAECSICVIAGICGDVEEVLAAFQTGRLDEERFSMPGCCGQRRRRRGGCRRQGLSEN